MLKTCVVAAVVFGCAIPATAAAATVELVKVGEEPAQLAGAKYQLNHPVIDHLELRVTGSGEADHVDVDGLRVTGSGALDGRCALPGGCSGSVVCEAEKDTTTRWARVSSLRVDLGDGDDRARVRGALPDAVLVAGGPGADHLHVDGGTADGGEGDDVLLGGPLPERMLGGPGADVLDGGDGDDELLGGPGRDRLSGGAGKDMASWEDETVPVAVDLSAPAAGNPAEPDAIDGFEGARGGAGDDTLLGTGHSDTLYGGPGADRLSGSGGDDALLDEAPGETSTTAGTHQSADVLDGGPGNDSIGSVGGADVLRGGDGNDDLYPDGANRRVDAGRGNDTLSFNGRGRTSPLVTCGSGRDEVEELNAPAVVPRDCERALVDYDSISTVLRVRRGALLVPTPDCAGGDRIELRSSGRTVGRTRCAAKSPVAIAVDRRLRRALRRNTIDVRYRLDDGWQTLRLRVPRGS